jgi:hypothetical protein
MNDIKFILPESSEHSVEGRIGDRVALAPRRFNRSESMGIGVGLSMPDEIWRENVDVMTSVTQLLN